MLITALPRLADALAGRCGTWNHALTARDGRARRRKRAISRPIHLFSAVLARFDAGFAGDHAFASVWCFFAAALSLYLCMFFATLPGPMRTPDVAERPGI